jgi:threonine aldolase
MHPTLSNETQPQAGTPLTPQHTENSVIFRGDGEPQSPKQLLNNLSEAHEAGLLQPDSYGRGGSVAALEERFAEMLGKEAAVFFPTGTLANHMAIRALCGNRRRALVQEQSHLYHDTGDCVTQLSGINLIPLARDQAHFTLEDVRQAATASYAGRVDNPIGTMTIESPVRRQMGQVMPLEEMRAITEYCREQGIGTHLDGARLYMMSAATGIDPKEYTRLFDTVYVSLYKYFGAPFGAILAGDADKLKDMYHERRMFGGALSSAYMAAALALQGSVGFQERFNESLSKARDLFSSLNQLSGVEITELGNGSNIFPIAFESEAIEQRLVSGLRDKGVFLFPDEGEVRVTRLTVNTTLLRQSNHTLLDCFKAVFAGA